eukprot:14250548-Alexandrium_andersonii.AAC.1
MSASLVGSEMCIRDSPMACILGASRNYRKRRPGVFDGTGLQVVTLAKICLLYTSDAADDM